VRCADFPLVLPSQGAQQHGTLRQHTPGHQAPPHPSPSTHIGWKPRVLAPSRPAMLVLPAATRARCNRHTSPAAGRHIITRASACSFANLSLFAALWLQQPLRPVAVLHRGRQARPNRCWFGQQRLGGSGVRGPLPHTSTTTWWSGPPYLLPPWPACTGDHGVVAAIPLARADCQLAPRARPSLPHWSCTFGSVLPRHVLCTLPPASLPVFPSRFSGPCPQRAE
jgi:hypothetical protein